MCLVECSVLRFLMVLSFLNCWLTFISKKSALLSLLWLFSIIGSCKTSSQGNFARTESFMWYSLQYISTQPTNNETFLKQWSSFFLFVLSCTWKSIDIGRYFTCCFPLLLLLRSGENLPMQFSPIPLPLIPAVSSIQTKCSAIFQAQHFDATQGCTQQISFLRQGRLLFSWSKHKNKSN